jgi:uncharacterized protein YdeI (YjbR/CyaY-like superfamily)
MTTKKTNPKVDAILRKAEKWQAELQKLREIVLDCGLTEELKWYQPCYTSEGRNIVLIHGFKEYCALLFFKGVLMKDPKGLLITQTENVQSGRQIRFTGLDQIVKMEPILKAYVQNAIEVEKSGAQVPMKKTSDFKVCEELQEKLDESTEFKKAFYALTPGRQRAYLLYFAAAKQSETRAARVEKYRKDILNGKGLNDDYAATKKKKPAKR